MSASYSLAAIHNRVASEMERQANDRSKTQKERLIADALDDFVINRLRANMPPTPTEMLEYAFAVSDLFAACFEASNPPAPSARP